MLHRPDAETDAVTAELAGDQMQDGQVIPPPPEDSRYWQERQKAIDAQIVDCVHFNHDVAILGSDGRFGELVENFTIANQVTEQESKRLRVDPDSPLFAQLSHEIGAALIEKYGLTPLMGGEEGLITVTLRSIATALVARASASAGTTERCNSIDPGHRTKEETSETSIRIGLRLLQEYTLQLGSKPEGIILTSSLLSTDTAERIIDRALEQGILTQRPKSFEIRMFCSGSTVAVMAALAHPEFRTMQNVAILALEPISALIDDERQYGFDSFHPTVVFTDNYLIMRINPQELELLPESAGQIEDDDGVIYIGTDYTIPPGMSDGFAEWMKQYVFSAQKESDLELLHSDDGQLLIETRVAHDPSMPRAGMDGPRTAKFFASHPQLFLQVYQVLRATYGDDIRVANHEPSLMVAKMLNHRFEKAGTDLRFLFEGVGNASSATMPEQLRQLAKNGRAGDYFGDNCVTMLAAPGIGASFVAAGVRPRRSELSPTVSDGALQHGETQIYP